MDKKPKINIIYQNNSRKTAIVYPTDRSIPGPYLQSYINIPRFQYMY
jgi:hypothetical protein